MEKGLYEWAVTLMGLKRLPTEFVHFMTYVLIQYLNKFVAVYFDDIIVYSKDPNKHEGHVRQVMTTLMEPTHDRTPEKGRRIVWNDKRQKAFDKLKQLVTKALILALNDPEKRKIIRPDASGYALGIAFEQVGSNGIVQTIAFYSRQFTAAEMNYDVHDRELLAIVEAFKQ
ncbi:retrovirus polyprotein, putative [Talaromyces stipitatus ATCC 10500]|uniref:Retrovirus polyprotein, putative n=1 Tax=Talaromyces stipitatus (strain ATCC 10500 / CBS 375.48 / QM 6759 / NRRL 1006) TaxID=441959 RepID=B8M7B8_TALSN|nr:retrovirus polyprotein, putative [Talaromyces stipitatus ATCC 10500]EED20338.1 retrovirus polyprotein, putative [Talaromyces stipitatus ATCC 10500]